MPLTPYHLGPAILIGLILFPRLELSTFLIANVILDVEPFLILLLGWNCPLHGVFHSLTIGTIVGIALAFILYMVRNYLVGFSKALRLPQICSFKYFVISSLLGVWLHVALDAFLYPDLQLFYPLSGNILLGLIDRSILHEVLAICFPLSIFAYIIRVNIEKGRSHTEDSQLSKEKVHKIEAVEESAQRKSTQKPSVKTREEKKVDIPSVQEKHNKGVLETSRKKCSIEPVEWDMPEIILGCDKKPEQWGIIGEKGSQMVGLDLNEPHIVFVCGKQGSGKGYTIGAICEMLLSRSIPNISQVSKPATIIVFHRPREDIRSEFWSIVRANTNDREVEKLLRYYGMKPTRVITKNELRIFVDPFVYLNEEEKFEKDYGANVYPIGINPGRLTSEDWPHVLSIGKRSGSIYVKKIFQIIKRHQYDGDFGLEVIRGEIDESSLNTNQKNFAYMRLETLEDYLKAGDFIEDIKIGGVNIFDLRKIMMEPDDVFSVMMLVISSILNTDLYSSEQIVFVINEAHDYLRKGLSKDFTDYINYLVRKKRHAGTWLMLDTHFPEDVDSKIIKGSDIKIFHKADILSSDLLKRIVEGSEEHPHRLRTGQAIIRSDKSLSGPDKILVVNVRPRLTHHGAPTKVAV
ncbi:MAG: hypothetical protein ACLFVP_03270 [Candidatus Bathyarchaeia archaeon]